MHNLLAIGSLANIVLLHYTPAARTGRRRLYVKTAAAYYTFLLRHHRATNILHGYNGRTDVFGGHNLTPTERMDWRTAFALMTRSRSWTRSYIAQPVDTATCRSPWRTCAERQRMTLLRWPLPGFYAGRRPIQHKTPVAPFSRAAHRTHLLPRAAWPGWYAHFHLPWREYQHSCCCMNFSRFTQLTSRAGAVAPTTYRPAVDAQCCGQNRVP